AVCAQPVAQLVIKRKVDVHRLVQWAVEGSHRRLAHSAGRRRGAGEEDQRGLGVVAPHGAEDVAPRVLRGGEDPGYHVSPRVVRRRRGRAARARRRVPALLLQHRTRVATHEHHDESDHQRPDPTSHHTAPHPPAVLDVAAPPDASETHSALPWLRFVLPGGEVCKSSARPVAPRVSLAAPPRPRQLALHDPRHAPLMARSNRLSAGLLLFRRGPSGVEVFLAHPGGPFWRRRDIGAWTVPKGIIEEGEDPLDAARREFEEETGIVPSGPFIPLGSIRQKAGKTVHAW